MSKRLLTYCHREESSLLLLVTVTKKRLLLLSVEGMNLVVNPKTCAGLHSHSQLHSNLLCNRNHCQCWKAISGFGPSSAQVLFWSLSPFPLQVKRWSLALVKVMQRVFARLQYVQDVTQEGQCQPPSPQGKVSVTRNTLERTVHCQGIVKELRIIPGTSWALWKLPGIKSCPTGPKAALEPPPDHSTLYRRGWMVAL